MAREWVNFFLGVYVECMWVVCWERMGVLSVGVYVG